MGDLIDFDPTTPGVKVTLERSERGIGITVPWSDDDSPYAEWFLGEHRLKIPSSGEPAVAPSRVLFQDSHGSILLTRCWARGFHSNMLGPGSGTLWSRAAILGVHDNVDFDHPNGLQTEITGLREWLGVTSWSENYDRQRGRLVATIASLEPAPIEIATVSALKLAFRPGWRVVPEERKDRRIILDLLSCETRSDEPIAWTEHMQAHRAIRDLLVLSRWHAESCVEVRAMRSDDPLTTMDGETHGEQWREVVVPNDEPTPATTGFRQHLITFAELGEDGVSNWLALRDEFARALDPVVSSIGLRSTSADTVLAQTGPGLEALGYLLMIRDGVTARAAGRANLHTRFERILKDLGDVLPFDGLSWARNTIAAYNGLKHANRDAPDPVDVLNGWRQSVMVVRAWVAIELGIPPAQLKQRLASDPQRSPFVAI
ncbi:ApeA N-terminal domain 1-containing protein [Leifsonia aquatica]|uniref:ApeA N-terminal domain 1-containing protein n=1 Tax=Leifsonia aquatica TaxID=144185 RepID=UPI0028B046F8|nr:HEPN domain-containing protein [Leifsonia aquatica]